jgi:hypothetical protein
MSAGDLSASRRAPRASGARRENKRESSSSRRRRPRADAAEALAADAGVSPADAGAPPPARTRSAADGPAAVDGLVPDSVAAAALGACAVCQQPQEAGARVCFLPCAHAFHSHCIERWLREYKPECPLCRARVRAPPPRPAPQVVCLYLDEAAGAVLR